MLNAYGWINLVPLLIGVFWGGPLIARELEQDTHRPAWTQSIGRGRWLLAKLGVFMLGAVVMAAAVAELMTWWFEPIEHIREDGQDTFGRLNPDVFDFRGIVPVAYTLFAFALGLAAGAILKRTLPAMVVTLVGYLPVKLVVQDLRAHFMTPLKVSYAFGTTSPRAATGDWVVNHSLTQNGQVLDHIQLPEPWRPGPGRGLRRHARDPVPGRVPADQPVLAAPVHRVGNPRRLSAVLLAVAAWWIIRRLP